MNWCKCRRCGQEYDYNAPENAVGAVDELCSQCLQDTDRWLQARYKAREAFEEVTWSQVCRGTKYNPKRMIEI